MKKILLLSLLYIGFTSCQSQKKLNIEKLSFDETGLQFLEDTFDPMYIEPFYTSTHHPTAYIHGLTNVELGEIKFTDQKNEVIYFYLTPDMNKIEGLSLSINGKSTAEKVKKHLYGKYGNPILLMPNDFTRENKIDTKNKTYYWKDTPNKTNTYVAQIEENKSFYLKVYIVKEDAGYYNTEHSHYYKDMNDFIIKYFSHLF